MECKTLSVGASSLSEKTRLFSDNDSKKEIYGTPRNLEIIDDVLDISEKKATLKNLIVVSLGYTMFFTGFASLSNLQSTMNVVKNLGLKSQSIIYVFAILSSLLFPKIIMRFIGCKRTIIVMLAINCSYIISNFYPTSATLLTTATVYGLTSGPLCTAQSFYINQMAIKHASRISDSIENVAAQFFGIFSFFLSNTQIWGNIISYLVLKPSITTIATGIEHSNSTVKCGIYFDIAYQYNYSNANPNLEPPTDEKRYLLVGIYTLLGISAVVFEGIFLDSLDDVSNASNAENGRRGTMFKDFLAALNHLKNVNQLFLIPLTIFIGQEMAFYQADYTQAFIACFYGIYYVGYVSICFGVSGALTALSVGFLVRRFGQLTLLVFAILFHVTVWVVMFLWASKPQSIALLFFMAALWGSADAILWSQLPALYGEIFSDNKEAAFSNFWLWSFLGFFLSFTYSSFTSISVKIYLLICFLTLGSVGYVVAKRKLQTSYTDQRQNINSF